MALSARAMSGQDSTLPMRSSAAGIGLPTSSTGRVSYNDASVSWPAPRSAPATGSVPVAEAVRDAIALNTLTSASDT